MVTENEKTMILAQKSEEYKALRAEVVSFQGGIMTGTAVIGALAGAEITTAFYVFKPIVSGIIFLLIFPITFLILISMWIIVSANAKRISKYICDSIEGPVQKLLGNAYTNWLGTGQTAYVMGWETARIASPSNRNPVWILVCETMFFFLVFSILPGYYFVWVGEAGKDWNNLLPLLPRAVLAVRTVLSVLPWLVAALSVIRIRNAVVNWYQK